MNIFKKFWEWVLKEYWDLPEYCKVSCKHPVDPNAVNPFILKRPEQK